jgi:hypothetical protein
VNVSASTSYDFKAFTPGPYVKITNKNNAHHFLQYKGIVHFEFIAQGHTVKQAYY